MIQVNECPIAWTIKLQTEIAVSTMEAEYVAMSTAMRDLLPMMDIFHEVFTSIGLKEIDEQSIISTVWEDNAGALKLGQIEPPKITPMSKHYSLKYHWFREKLVIYKIQLKQISSEYQLADILTKELGKLKLQFIRKIFMGW